MAKASSAALLFFGGEAAIRICFHGVTQASGELFLDSSSPLLRFASALQLLARPPIKDSFALQ
jgi:hypothetical protein